MHRFLRAIGFSAIKERKDMDRILGLIMNKPDRTKKIKRNGTQYTEMSADFGRNMGIAIRGEHDKMGFFHLSHYFPYCTCRLFTGNEDVYINKRVDTNAYTAMCDDFHMGISLIFYLQNAIDYMTLDSPDNSPHKAKLSLSGLSLDGKIILGVEHSEDSAKQKHEKTDHRNQLIKQAKNGNQEAIDYLTMQEIDLNSEIQRRVKTQDLYSIVETSFFPYGSESDNYLIIGTIINWTSIENPYSHEQVYQMLVNCNDIVMNICINKNDLLGTPMIGCRFKGTIWMQGYVDFQKI